MDKGKKVPFYIMEDGVLKIIGYGYEHILLACEDWADDDPRWHEPGLTRKKTDYPVPRSSTTDDAV